jgi:hypothetical protein
MTRVINRASQTFGMDQQVEFNTNQQPEFLVHPGLIPQRKASQPISNLIAA